MRPSPCAGCCSRPSPKPGASLFIESRKSEESDASELLLHALGDEDWRVRKQAALVAPALERREELIASLVAALEETVNMGLRNAAVEALVAIGPEVAGATIEALSRLDADARKLAVEVLGGIVEARATVALTRALDDEDGNVRVAAAEALGGASLGGTTSREVAAQALVQTLATADVFLKIAALESLARLDAQLPWQLFEPFAKDPLLRRYAIAAAARSREPDALRALARATGDPSPTIAREAIVALGDCIAAGPDDSVLIEVARAQLRETVEGWAKVRSASLDAEDARARGGALLLLGLVGDTGDAASLVQALGDDDVAERADLALRLLGPGALDALLDAARAGPPFVRAASLELAASLEGADAERVRGALRVALADDSGEVVARAIEALGPLGEGHDLRRVSAFVTHPDERIAAAATTAAWELGARHVDAARALLRDTRAGRDLLPLGCILLGAIASTCDLHAEDIGLLERALSHDDPRVRRAAIDALAQAGSEAAATAVVFALADDEHEVRLAAVRALGRLGCSKPLVDVVADTRDPLLAAAALRALGEADPNRALASACGLVSHSEPAIACAAVEAVGYFAARAMASTPTSSIAAFEEALFSALEHTHDDVVKLALPLLGEQASARSLARIGLCLDHPSWEVRRLAAELLGHDKRAGAQGLLRARYDREKDLTVREAIAAAVSVRPFEPTRFETKNEPGESLLPASLARRKEGR